jgi:ketosteroid isomerase-like protein
VSREQNIALVESYLACFASKDPSSVPFADGVVFEGPTWPTLTGRQAVLRFLRLILPAIRRVQVKRHIVEGDHVATIFDMETDHGVEHVCDYIEIAGGEIARVQAFFYPRPIAPGD